MRFRRFKSLSWGFLLLPGNEFCEVNKPKNINRSLQSYNRHVLDSSLSKTLNYSLIKQQQVISNDLQKLEKFKMWTVEFSEHIYLSEIKAQKETLRLQFTGWSYFFLSAYIFQSTQNISIKIFLMSFVYKTVAPLI